MKHKLLCLFLFCCLLLSVPALAGDADVLFDLGLFKGSGTLPDGSPDYALERTLSRQEAVTMLVRLLGKEQEAKDSALPHPFSDVDDWAAPYVGYAYCSGLTNGLDATTFGGGQPVTAAQYLTFALRALGYVSGTDFAWAAAWEKTDALGITEGQYNPETNSRFVRADAVAVSRRALEAALKDGTATLLEGLVAEGAVTETAAQQSGLLPDEYTLFAREIVAAGKDPITVSLDENNQMGRAALASIFKEYDGYAGSAATLERALAGGFDEYLKNCLDGDYSDGYSGTPSFSYWTSTVDAFFLTDTKGTIIAYGVRTDKTSKDFTMYFCRVNSKTFMDARVKEMKAQLDSIAEIPCEAAREGSRYVFRFPDLPENAVWFDPGGQGSKGNTSKRGYDVDRQLLSKWMALQKGHYPNTPVQDVYSCDAYYSLDMAGTAYHFFYFMDADYNLIGYALGKVPIN